MPQLKASGDIFTANANAGFDEGIISGKIGGGVRLNVAAELDICHGLNAQLSAEASADAEANLHLLWVLLGKAQGQALASAGAQLTGQLNASLFESFGLSAEAAIYAQASLAGSLGLGLDVGEIARLARGALRDNLAYDIFIAFLNETTLEFGVWGKISAAAMAHAHLNIRGTLSDDEEAGFLIEAGADAGWTAGGGYDVYGGIRLDEPKRFFAYASERITREIVSFARTELPPDLRPGIAVLEFILPLTLNASYELGQAAVFDALGNPDQLTRKFTGAFFAQLQKFTLDRLAETGFALIRGYLQDALDEMFYRDLSSQQRETIHSLALELAEAFRLGEFSLDDYNRILTRLADLLTLLFPDVLEEWRRPISIGWAALAAAEAVREGVENLSASASVEVVGLGEIPVGGEVVYLPDPPALVRAEFEAFFEDLPSRLELGHAVAYLQAVCLQPLVRAALPEVALFFDSLSARTGISAGDLLTTCLQGASTQDISQTVLYRRLRDFVKDHVDGIITQTLLPELSRAATWAHNDLLRKWLDQVARPSLLLLSGFAFERLDAAISGALTGDLSPFTSTFRMAFSTVVGRIVNLNVILIAEITLNFTLDGLRDGFLSLERVARSDPRNAIAAAAPQFFRQLVPLGQLLPSTYDQASLELAGDLLHAFADGFGPQVFTTERKTRLIQLWKQALDSIDGQVNYADPQSVEAFFAAAAECNFIPNPQCVIDLLGLETEIVAGALQVSLPQVLDALKVFMLNTTLATVTEFENLARDLLEGLRAGLNRLANLLEEAIQRFNARVAELQAAARKSADKLRAARNVLKRPARRTEILNRLRATGIARAQRNVRNTPGFDLQPIEVQNAELSAAVGAFTLAFDLARPIFDACLGMLAPLADGLATLLDSAASLPDLISRMVDEASRLITRAANDALDTVGLSLPKELSIDDIIDAVEEMLNSTSVVKDALREAIEATQSERQSRRLMQLAENQKAQVDRDYQRAAKNLQALSVDTLQITIASPLPFSLGANGRGKTWSYGRNVPVVIEVRGATSAFLKPSNGNRILLAINGAALPLQRAKWHYDAAMDGLVFEAVLGPGSAGIKPGMNILECSVVTGQKKIFRKSVSFLSNHEVANRGLLRVDPRKSRFNAPGRDPHSLQQEKIVLQNQGLTPLNLAGWRIFDLGDHQFVLPPLRLAAGRSVTIHTGSGKNSPGHLYMDKDAAIWNSSGDVVHLVDDRSIVTDFYQYRKG